MKVVIDCDPGQDDAAAILMALGARELDVLGVTTVAGNVPLRLTSRNARIVCELAGRPDIPVFAGADAPLAGKGATAEHAHGCSGLDGPALAEPSMPLQTRHAVDFLVETVRREPPRSVTLVAIGPLTNVALAFGRAPDLAEQLDRIVLMGGGYFAQGNITPAAEFNIFVDPEAAQAVFRSSARIVMAPLDVTHKVIATNARAARIREIGSPAAVALSEMLTFYGRYNAEKYGFDGGPLHDPLTIAWLLAPEMFSGRDCNVEVETESPLTRGATVIDWWGVTDRRQNAFVLGDVDAEAFFALLTEKIAAL